MKFIVWTKPNCPNCDQAKALLKNKGIEYEERNIGVDWTKEQLLEAVPMARTVPQILMGEEYVGGYTELKQKLTKE
jgi:glutaredoxin 3